MEKNIKLIRGEGNFMAVRKNITWKKRKQYHLLYNIGDVKKNIKGKKGKETEFSGKEIKI